MGKKNSLSGRRPPRKQGQGESLTSPRRLEARERAVKALQLRKEGWTYDEIAREKDANGNPLYRDRRTAHMAVTALLYSTAQEPADEVRQLELQRLDMLLNKLMPGINEGVPSSVSVAIRLMERRSKLLGLDAPERTEIEIKIDLYNVILKEVVAVFLDVNKAPDELARAADFARRVDQLAKERLLTPGLPGMAATSSAS